MSTNDQAPTYETPSFLSPPESGEKLSVAFGKIRRAITNLISHISSENNPHKVTASQVGAASQSHTHSAVNINSGTLSPLRGGTGLSGPISGGLLKANGANACTSLRGVGALYSLTVGNPTFGVLPVSMGGTGAENLSSLAESLISSGLTRIISGSYIGGGKYGLSYPTFLSFPSAPSLLVVMPQNNEESAMDGGFIVIRGVTSIRAGGIMDDEVNPSSQLYFSWSGSAVSWYGTSASYQQNSAGKTYCYVAFL